MPRRGGLIGVLGTGVGMAAEYHEHRKAKKLSRENSQQDANTLQASSSNTSEVGSSSRPQAGSRSISSTNDLPPTYEDSVGDVSERSIASGGPPTDDKKQALRQYDEDDDDESDDVPTPDEEEDENDWALDEVIEREANAKGLPSYDEAEEPQKSENELINEVLTKNRAALAAAPGFERTPLPVPVIIPQRRPRNKKRGFVHAYAPLLGECSGIGQDTFITFIKNFQESSQASPVFPIIKVAAGIAGFAPSVIAMAVTTAVQVAAGVGEELQARSRTNHFLDEMNAQLFQPAGLYAMIVKYKTDAEVAASGSSLFSRLGVSGEKVDLNTNQTIAKYHRGISEESAGKQDKSMTDRLKNIRLASSTTKGATQMPLAAPLIFPEIDRAVAAEGEEGFKAKAKDVGGFLADYMDRRAQVKYANSDPNSTLNLPEKQRAFRSKLADPNHPMYNGGIVGFVSGGYLSRARGSGRGDYDRRSDRRMAKDDRRMARYEDRLDSGRGLSRKKESRYNEIRDARMQYGDEDDDQYGRRRGGRRGGPISSLIGLAANAIQERSQQNGSSTSGVQSREYEDANDSRLRPSYEDEKSYRRSLDERGYATAGSSSNLAPYAEQGYTRSTSPYDRQSYGAAGGYGRRQRRQKKGGALGVVKKVMTEDVLYLMIVNMPSEAELAEARETMARAKNSS